MLLLVLKHTYWLTAVPSLQLGCQLPPGNGGEGGGGGGKGEGRRGRGGKK